MKVSGTLVTETGTRLSATLHLPPRLAECVTSAALEDVLASLPPSVAQHTTVVVHGTLVTQLAYYRMAEALVEESDQPVVTYDRRGRMDSSPQPDNYTLATEVADLAAVLSATGSSTVFGHSFGALTALMTALQDERVKTVVCFDAPMNLDGTLDAMWTEEPGQALSAGDPGKAWALLIKAISTAGPLAKLPLGILTQVARVLPLTGSGREQLQLLHTCLAEMRTVVDTRLSVSDFAGLPPTTLFTAGFSPEYFVRAAQRLTEAMPHVRWENLPGYFHNGPLMTGPRMPGTGMGDDHLAKKLVQALYPTGS